MERLLEKMKNDPEVAKILKKLKEKQDRLLEVLKQCPHENYKSENGSNTGNYDLYESYWVNVECLDCGKFMTFDSKENPKEYRKYSK